MNTALSASCDAGVARSAAGRAVAHPRWTIAATMFASSLAFIDGSVTNVALPAIGKDLGGSASDLSWTINAYLLPLSALLLIGGALGDHHGRRRVLVVGVALYTLASIGCALAPSLGALLAFRGLQGIGAALLLPNSLGILGSAFEGEARGRAVGTWAAAGAIASAIGPPLGGWLIDTVGWRSIFYLNVPVAGIAVMLFARFVAETGRGEDPLDWRGAALATTGLGTLTWALTAWSTRHEATMVIWASVAAGLALLSLFVAQERRLHDKAMMPLLLFASKAFVGLTVLTFLLYGALGGLLLLLPYLLIVGGGYTPSQAGLALLPFSIVVGLASRLAGRMTETIGPRWPLTLGPIVTGLGFALLGRADPHASYWTSVLPGMAVIALGMAGAVAPLTTAVLAAVDERHTGTASGFNSAISRTGGLIATALAGGVISRQGGDLISTFQAAALAAATCAAAAGIIAWLTLEGAQRAD